LSILVNAQTRVIVQGITGREGGFHAGQCIAYGTNVEEGRQLLRQSGLNFQVASSFEDAAIKVARCVGA